MDRIEEQKKIVESRSVPYVDQEHKSEMGNDLAAFNHTAKLKRSIKVLHFLEKVQPELEKLNISVKEFNTNSFRITDGIKQIDFYPSKGKLFTAKKKWKNINNGDLVIKLINELT